MSTQPKSVTRNLRMLAVMVGSIRADIEKYLEDPTTFHAPEYFEDVLDMASGAEHLVQEVRNQLKVKP